MHICLISPGHLSTNPRLVKEARSLRGAGYRVSIVCGAYLESGTAADQVLAAELAPVYPVRFGPRIASKAVYLRQGLARLGARWAVRVGLNSAALIEIAQHPAARDLQRAAARIPADLYVAHYVAALPAAARAARKHGGKFSFDAEDFHLGDLPDEPTHEFEKGLINSIEARYLPGAAHITAASPMIAQAYCETYEIALPATVLNAFPRALGPASPSTRGTIEPGPGLYWFSQTIGPGRGLEAAVAAIAIAQSQPHLYLRGTADPRFATDLLAQAARLGVGSHVHILPTLHPDALERGGTAFDLGYCGELANSRNHAMALSNKLFSYLTSGLPVVASDIPSHCAVAAQLGDAVSLFESGDPASLAAAIDRCLVDPAGLAARRRYAWELGQGQFSWERQEGVLLALVSASSAEEAR